MLPEHWVDQGIGSLDTSRQTGQLPAGDQDPSLIQHAGEDNEHGVAVHCVEVFCEVPVLRDAGQVEGGWGGPGEDILIPLDIEDQARKWNTGRVDAGQEGCQMA